MIKKAGCSFENKERHKKIFYKIAPNEIPAMPR